MFQSNWTLFCKQLVQFLSFYVNSSTSKVNNRLCLSKSFVEGRGGGGWKKNKKSSTQSTQTVRFNGEKCCFHPKERNQIIICCRALVSRDFPKLGHDTHNNHEIFHSTFILFLTNIARTKIAQQAQKLPRPPHSSYTGEKEWEGRCTVSQHLGKRAHLSNGWKHTETQTDKIWNCLCYLPPSNSFVKI